jgi:hypothetical protein
MKNSKIKIVQVPLFNYTAPAHLRLTGAFDTTTDPTTTVVQTTVSTSIIAMR